MKKEHSVIPLSQAVETIKTAILQGQYEALKEVNRVQLAVYYAIGKYLSRNTRSLAYGSGGIKTISDQLRKEMPGLRGFSATQLKDMRRFYEAWEILDSNNTETSNEDSTVTTVESYCTQNQIDIRHAITIPNLTDFPVEDFFNVPFTHHSRIINLCKDVHGKYYYIHRTAQEKLSVENLEKLIKRKAYENQDRLPTRNVETHGRASLRMCIPTSVRSCNGLPYHNKPIPIGVFPIFGLKIWRFKGQDINLRKHGTDSSIFSR